MKNSPKTWKVFSEILNGKKTLEQPRRLVDNGTEISKPGQMIETFNDYFGHIGRNLAENTAKPFKFFQYFLHEFKQVSSTIVLFPRVHTRF